MTYKVFTAIVDIDSTIADIDHRLPYINGISSTGEPVDCDKAPGEKDWDSFHSMAWKDKPIRPTISLVRALHKADWGIILCTGRSAESYDLTVKWLKEYNVPYDLLLMRPFGDHRSKDVDLKRAWLNDLRTGRISIPGMREPQLAIEDRQRCVDMWREEGLIALQCAEGNF